MAMLAVFGFMSYSVQQRTVEIGTRMALGAAFYVGRVFQIEAIGPVPFLYSVGLVAAMAIAASLAPAWRATLLSPLVAMRASR